MGQPVEEYHLDWGAGEELAVGGEDGLEEALLAEPVGPPAVGVGREAGAAGVAPGLDPPLVQGHPRQEEAVQQF